MSRRPRVEFIVTADTRQAMSGFQNLTGAITSGVFRGGLALKAFDAGLGAIQNSVASLTNSIAAATDTQIKTIAATSALSSLGNITYDRAQTAVEDLNQQLAKSAAILPGVTDDYKQLAQGISSSLVEAFKNPEGTLNIEGWKGATKELSENFGALTATTTKDAANTSLAINKALGGATTAGLRQIAFFEQNKAVLDEIDRALKSQNAESLNDVSVETRVKILTAASQKLITDDFKKAAGESVDGLMQNFNTALFDPSAGIFGVMRDLQPDMKGVQSVFSAYNETLSLIIGSDGVLFGIGKILNQLGFQIDPMKVIYGGLLKFNSGISQVSALVSDISRFVEQTGTKNATVLQSGIKALFGRFLGIVPNFKMPETSTKDDYKSPTAGLKPILDMGAKISVGDIAAKVKDRIGGMVDSVFARISEAVQTVRIVINSEEFTTGVTLIKRVLTRVIIEDFLPGVINIGADLAILITDAITGLVIKPSAGDAQNISGAFVRALAKIDYGKLREAISKVVRVAITVNLATSLATLAFARLATQVVGIVSAAILTPLRGALVAGLLNYVVPLAAAIVVPIQTAFAGIGAGVATALGGGLMAGGLATAGLALSATAGSLYLFARLMGASNKDIAYAAGNWATEASALTGIKVDGISSAIAAGFEIIRLSAVERLSQISKSTGVEINSLGDAMVANGNGQMQLIQTGIDYIYNSTITSIADLRSNFSIWLSGIKKDAKSAFDSFISSFQSLTTSVQNRINTFVKLVVNIWDNIVKAIQNAGLQLQNSLRRIPVIGGFIPSPSPSASVSPISPISSISSPSPSPSTPSLPRQSSSGVFNQFLNLFSPKPKYAGQNIQSFLETIKTETKNSPGASLVVANSSEIIIPKQSLPKILARIIQQSATNREQTVSNFSSFSSISSLLASSRQNNYNDSTNRLTNNIVNSTPTLTVAANPRERSITPQPQSVTIKQATPGKSSMNIESIVVNISNNQPSQQLSARDISQQMGELLRHELSKLL
ncbi:hypothetical protein [Kamptonema sp. UHCC 0994]|uniref:hypothetical protein n=1 Tax=Kamptonema sp. UHCC 0994 TaxID=3031329 RepID=UPI0023B961AF|nr:hypothetical protein [Kamptonema sp. UHCC 0994]MDF0554911.1 hypothetical protein [Kamptonema sp. UHCC 0994]